MHTRRSIRFGPFELDLGTRQLSREGDPVQLSPTPFTVLAHLAQHPGQPVTKDDLIEAVWQAGETANQSSRSRERFQHHLARRKTGKACVGMQNR